MWYVVFGSKGGLKVRKIHDQFTAPSDALVNAYGFVHWIG